MISTSQMTTEGLLCKFAGEIAKMAVLRTPYLLLISPSILVPDGLESVERIGDSGLGKSPSLRSFSCFPSGDELVTLDLAP